MSRRTLLFFFVVSFIHLAPAQAQVSIRGPAFGQAAGQATGSSHTVTYLMGQSSSATGAGATHSVLAGFWGASPHITAVDPPVTPDLPAVDYLHQNLPNPFNPATTITYDIASSAGPVSLRLYDAGGRLVRTLVTEVQGPGRHSIVWHGRDNRGSPVGSGVYYYSLKTPRNHFTKKMLLLR
jgi:hypothetical protein